MNKAQGSVALKGRPGKVEVPAGKAASTTPPMAKRDEVKRQAAYDKVKEVLKNSRHS